MCRRPPACLLNARNVSRTSPTFPSGSYPRGPGIRSPMSVGFRLLRPAVRRARPVASPGRKSSAPRACTFGSALDNVAPQKPGRLLPSHGFTHPFRAMMRVGVRHLVAHHRSHAGFVFGDGQYARVNAILPPGKQNALASLLSNTRTPTWHWAGPPPPRSACRLSGPVRSPPGSLLMGTSFFIFSKLVRPNCISSSADMKFNCFRPVSPTVVQPVTNAPTIPATSKPIVARMIFMGGLDNMPERTTSGCLRRVIVQSAPALKPHGRRADGPRPQHGPNAPARPECSGVRLPA